MRSLIFGAVATIVIVVLSAHGDSSHYMQRHSLILVVGGTITLLFFCTPDGVLRSLVRSSRRLFEKDESFSAYTQELVHLANTKRLAHSSQNPLIHYATQLWEQGVDRRLFVALLSQKRAELETEAVDTIQALKNLAKYPPALGMTGTVMGMIALFSTLDKNRENVGTNLAIAMTATLFGLLVTNMFLGPVADRLQVKYVHQKRLYNSIYQILLLINQGEPLTLISGELEDKVA